MDTQPPLRCRVRYSAEIRARHPHLTSSKATVLETEGVLVRLQWDHLQYPHYITLDAIELDQE